MGCSNFEYRISDYRKVCPQYNGFVDEIAPGKQIRYLCDTHALHYDRINLRRDSSVIDCATHCLNTPGCLSSMFKAADNVCFVSNETQATAPIGGYVYMIQESKSVDPGCEEERRRVQDCERKLKELQSKLGQPGQSEPPVPKPTQGFDGAGCDNWWNACSRSCESSNVFVDGVEYEKRCLIKPRLTTYHYSDAYTSPTECLKGECSGRTGCIGIQWIKSEKVSLQILPFLRCY